MLSTSRCICGTGKTLCPWSDWYVRLCVELHRWIPDTAISDPATPVLQRHECLALSDGSTVKHINSPLTQFESGQEEFFFFWSSPDLSRFAFSISFRTGGAIKIWWAFIQNPFHAWNYNLYFVWNLNSGSTFNFVYK